MASIEDLVKSVMADLKMPYDLKKEQLLAVECVMRRKDTFCLLPTGFGKSNIFVLATLARQKLDPTNNKMAIVVCPLRSLVRDQVRRWKCLGVKVGGLLPKEEMTDGDVKEIEDGVNILFTNPESILDDKWFGFIRKHKRDVEVLVFDEVHCMITWGNTFRAAYKELRQLRAMLSSTPVLCLTATTTDAITSQVEEMLGVVEFEKIFMVPDRPNIHIDMTMELSTVKDHLAWYVKDLIKLGDQAPKSVIFCRSIDGVSRTYGEIVQELEKHGVDDSIVEMFHAHLDKDSEIEIPEDFSGEDSHIRCLVSTVAFGMGVQVPDITYAIHWGAPSSSIDYFQETGRCARDGRIGYALLYSPFASLRSDRVSDSLLKIIRSKDAACMRFALLKSLEISKFSDSDISACCYGDACCGFCDKKE